MKFLREIFDSSYPVKHEKTQKFDTGESQMTSHYHSFRTPHAKYLIVMDHFHKKNTLDVAFHAASGAHSTKISGKEGRESHRVFSTIKNHISNFVKENPRIKKVTFSGAKDGNNESRNKLYTHMARSMTGVKKNEPNKHKEFDIGSGIDYHVNTKDIV